MVQEMFSLAQYKDWKQVETPTLVSSLHDTNTMKLHINLSFEQIHVYYSSKKRDSRHSAVALFTHVQLVKLTRTSSDTNRPPHRRRLTLDQRNKQQQELQTAAVRNTEWENSYYLHN